jgi:hypothetical protein
MSDDLAPHYYSPDYQAMGDCRVCGNVQDSWTHWSSGARSEIARLTAERDAEREARGRLEAALAKIKAGEWYVHDGEEYVVLLSAERCRDIAVDALRFRTPGEPDADR